MANFILLPKDKNNPRNVAEFINVDNTLRVKIIPCKNEVEVEAMVTFVNGETAIYKGKRAKELIDVMMEQRLTKAVRREFTSGI